MAATETGKQTIAGSPVALLGEASDARRPDSPPAGDAGFEHRAEAEGYSTVTFNSKVLAAG